MVYKDNLPVLGASEDGFKRYAADIKRFPLLTQEEEYQLAKDFQENNSKKSAHRLVTSHLRLVLAIAHKYKGYGLPIVDIVAEGNIGLIQAVKKFDPDKGFRLATYAAWWIRAAIGEYVLRSWSLVKIGTTSAQKKLFFSLNKARKQIDAIERETLRPNEIEQIADALNVPQYEVQEMHQRMIGSDMSLNVPLIAYEGEGAEWQDLLEDDVENQEITLAESSEREYRKMIMAKALLELPHRDQEIITARKIKDPPVILDDLSKKYGISIERVRQIEARAYKKLKENVKKLIEFHQPKLLD